MAHVGWPNSLPIHVAYRGWGLVGSENIREHLVAHIVHPLSISEPSQRADLEI